MPPVLGRIYWAQSIVGCAHVFYADCGNAGTLSPPSSNFGVGTRTKLAVVQLGWPIDVPALSQSARGGYVSTARDFQISDRIMWKPTLGLSDIVRQAVCGDYGSNVPSPNGEASTSGLWRNAFGEIRSERRIFVTNGLQIFGGRGVPPCLYLIHAVELNNGETGRWLAH